MTTGKLRPAFQPPLEGSCESASELNDARGAELEAMHDDVRAKRVRECGVVVGARASCPIVRRAGHGKPDATPIRL
jgi:hypothetical protein